MGSNNRVYEVTRWSEESTPTEMVIQCLLDDEGLQAYGWSNGPGDRYAAHKHSYDKVIYVVRGEIVFGLPDLGESVRLVAGDRLYLAQGVRHNASVGPNGVYCLEAHI